MLAVLRVAIRDFTKRCRRRDARFQEVRAWLFNPENDDVFAFESVCEALRLNPAKIRSGLLQWMKQRNTRTLSVSEAGFAAAQNE
jgi:hypothetical protein